MINPNINKLVLVEVQLDQQTALYRGYSIEINDYRVPAPKPGHRRMYLRYSIMSDRYYLVAMGGR